MIHRPSHDAGALDDLRQKHLPLTKQVTHRLHAPHQRPLDDLETRRVVPAGGLHVFLDVIGDPLDEGVRQSLLHAEGSPGVGLGDVGRVPLLDRLGVFDQPVGRVGSPIEEHVLDPLPQFGLDLLIDPQLPRVDDPHIHAGLNGVIQEAGVHRLADELIASKRERDVAHAPRDLHQRHLFLDPPRGLDEVDRVTVVLLDPGGNGEDVGVEDDVFGRKPGPLGEQRVGPLADRHATFHVGGLPLLVERHHHDRGAVAANDPRVLQERLLPLLEADRVDDALPLDALQPRLEHLKPRGVDHDRDLRDFWLAREQRQKLRHHLDAVEHALVDVDVDDVGPVFDLLPGDGQPLLVPLLLDQPGEGPRAGDVRPLAHDREAALGPQFQHLQARVPRPPRRRCGRPGRVVSHRVGDRLDVGRRRAAAAPHDVEPAVLGELLQHGGHHFGSLVEAAEGVGQPRVWIAAHESRCDPRQVGDVRAELLRTEGAVDPGRDQVDVRDARPAGLDRLGRKRSPSLKDREGGHHGQRHTRVGEHLLDRVQAALEHQRVEGGLGEQQVHAPFDERLNLLTVGRHHLVEGDVAVAGIGHVARDGELLVGRPDRTCHEPRPIGRLRRRGVGRLPGQLRGHEVHLPRVLLEPEIGQRHARGPERVGLDDVGACREVGGVNATDRLPLRERQHVDAVLEVAVVTRESLAAKTSLVERQGMHHGAHGAVEDRDAIFEDGAEKIGTGRGCGSRHRRSG